VEVFGQYFITLRFQTIIDYEKDFVVTETFKFLKSAILPSFFKHYTSYSFIVKDLYGSHQVSIHIYFNMNTAFYKILSSRHNTALW
jgi:hypothetical protein